MLSRVSPFPTFTLLLALGWVLLPQPAFGQKQPAPLKPNPQAPVLGMIFGGGMQRGTSSELLLTGSNLAGPTTLFTGFGAKVTIPMDASNGKDNAKLKVKIEIPATTPVGIYPVRLATTRGLSNLRLFCIDDLKQISEVDTNRNKSTPQPLPHPCVVTGKVEAESSDWYKITVKAGERLSFDVLGRRLGSDIDPQLTLYQAATGRELAHSNDAPGCQTDPRLNWTFKEAGDYLIEVKDVLNRGTADFWYRLRVGDFPLATVPLPMAVKRGQKTTIRFAGPHVAETAPIEITAPADRTITSLTVAPRSASGVHGWPVSLLLSDHDELLEQEPNSDRQKANRIPVPGGITGRLEQYEDVDTYVFAAKKGQKLAIEAQTLELGSPTLVYMVLRNSKGAELAKANPQAAPPADQRIDFTAPEDGDYFLEVQHLNYLGGPSEVYHLVITPADPTFELNVSLDRFDIAPTGMLSFPVTVNRKGYTGPIDLDVLSKHPGLTGKLKIAAGQNAGGIVVRAAADVPMGAQVIQLQGKASIDNRVVTVLASVRGPVSDQLAGLPFPPLELHHQIGLAIKEKPPFRLTLALEPAVSSPGLATALVVTAERDADFSDEIKLDPVAGLPAPMKPQPLPAIGKGQNRVQFKLPLDAKAPQGTFELVVSGKAKHQGKDFVVNSPPATLTLGPPFKLATEPMAKLVLKQDTKVKLKVSVTRQGGYAGPIALELKNLPAGVTAAKVTLMPGQNTAEIEIAAAATATIGTKNDVQIVGTATALNNLQGTSPNLTLEVQKK